jgi:hypothetical protein
MVKRIAITSLLLSFFLFQHYAQAQMVMPRGLPLDMTLTLEKPAPDQTFNNARTIDLGVGGHSYRFIVRDFFVNDPSEEFNSDDIWRSVENSKPNFQVQGLNSDVVAKIKPGEVITLQGIYAPVTRTFEVAEVRPGPGMSAPPKQY